MDFKCGFSLLELLIVMAIIAILVRISYPLYTSYLIKGRRNQAEIALFYLGSQMENYYVQNSTYQGADLQNLGVKTYTDDGSYQVAIQSVSEISYLLSAIPLETQKKGDTGCGTLSLDEQGEKFSNGTLSSKFCWD